MAADARARARQNRDGMASSASARSCCSISLKSRNAIEDAGTCRRLAKLMAELGWMAVRVRGLTRGGIWNKFAGIAANQSVTHDQQVAPTDHVDLFLPTNSKKVKR